MMFSFCSLILLSTFVGFLGLFYIWAKWKLSYWQRRGIPSLPTNVLFGNFRDSITMKIAPGYLLGRLYREAKDDLPFIGVYIMHRPFLIIRSPELMKQILVKDFPVFSNRFFGSTFDKSDPLSSQGLFAMKNPEWRHLRTKLSPAFTSGKIKTLFDLILESSESWKNHMSEYFADNSHDVRMIDFKDASKRFTTQVISSLAFGIKTNCFEKSEFYEKSYESFKPTLHGDLKTSCLFFFPQFSKFMGREMLGRNTKYFSSVFWNSMNSREEGKYERGDVIDSLLKLKNEKSEDGYQIKGHTLVAQSAIFFVAGLETSSTAVAFALWELAKNRKIQDRLRRHIIENLDEGKKVTYESVQKMKYLVAVINETMRLYPPAPIIDRVATRDYKIPGTETILEKGTVVYVALPGIHMDPKYHANPEIFDPERFSEERKNEIQPFTFMPFGEGPRMCIGLRIGMLQTAVGLITVLRDYEVFEHPKYKNSVSTSSSFTAPANGITLEVRKISAS